MAQQVTGQGMGAGTASGSVLVVDDEENLNWSLVTSLRRDNYVADGALSGEEALHRLAQRRYDFVISDVKMPGMDGFELLDYLRRHHPGTRVIMMTAFGSPTARQEAFRGGVVAFLEKPFDLRALKNELRRLANTASGQPGGFDVLDIAQVINLTRRDVTLAITNTETRGELRFVRGELVWAGAGTLRGDAAFYALAVPRALGVDPGARAVDFERNITQPLSRLIFQALTARSRGASTPTDPALGRPTPPPAAPPSAASGQPGEQRGEQRGEQHAAYASGQAPFGASSIWPGRATPRPMPPPASASPASASPAATPWSVSSVWPSATSIASAQPAQPSASGIAIAVDSASDRTDASTMDTSPALPTAAENDARGERARQALARLVVALGGPWCAVVTAADGTVIARYDEGFPAAGDGVYTHLAAAAQSSARALLLADWGTLEAAHLYSPQAFLLARRLGPGERAGLCILAGPRLSSPEGAARQAEHAETVLRGMLAEIAEALR